MKKLLFPSLILVLTITLGFVYKNYDQKKKAVSDIKETSVNVQLTSEWLNTQSAIEGLRDKIRRNPADLKAKLQLAMAYVQQSRITGDHAFFDDAALQLTNEILEKEPENFDALSVKATILLSQHHFTEGATLAEKITQTYPDAAFGYGLQCDAYVELGYYEKAMAAADKMNAIRPDLRSYSRIAYLREIFGDLEGAKVAMEMAVKAGLAGLEQTEWCRTQLAKLHELTGGTAKAQELYHIALITRPDYPYALAGLARLENNLDSAVFRLEKANKMMVDASFSDDLADVYLIHNQRVKSEQAAKKTIDMLGGKHDESPNHAHDENAPAHGHYADKELAEAYLKINDLTHALSHAQTELSRRPENIEVNELMAWVFYKNGEPQKALPFIEKALRTKIKNPKTLWKAGQIFLQAGQEKRGTELVEAAFKINKDLKTNIL